MIYIPRGITSCVYIKKDAGFPRCFHVRIDGSETEIIVASVVIA